MAQWQVPVGSSEPAGSVADLLQADEDLRTLVVQRSDGSLGAVARVEFFARMTGEMGFGWALRARRPIGALLEIAPVVFDVGTPVFDVGIVLLSNAADHSFEDIVVVDEVGERVGTVRIAEIFGVVGAELRRRSTSDELTGMLNRRGAVEHLRQMLSTCATAGDHGCGTGPCAHVLFVDLDRFKLVNDAFGHAAGDAVIREAGERLGASMPAGARSARVGGDEFLVVIPGPVAPSALAETASGISRALADPFLLDTGQVKIGASIGVAHARVGDDVDDVLRRADLAMYDGKRRGGGVVTDAAIDDVSRQFRLVQVEAAIGDAIESGDLHAAYQPIVSLETGALVGLEALARWELDGRPVSPGDFIPIAERTGRIPALTRHVLAQVATDLRDAQERTTGRAAAIDSAVGGSFVAVNVSASHYGTAGFARSILAQLERHDLDPDAIVLEITETVVFDHIDRIIESANELGREGVRLVLDDFGAGYSSMSALSRLPLAGVKLDRSLVASMPGDGRAVMTVASVVDLAHRLGLWVVAEGIELADERAKAIEAGCDHGQGYLFGRPGAVRPDTSSCIVDGNGSLGRPTVRI